MEIKNIRSETNLHSSTEKCTVLGTWEMVWGSTAEWLTNGHMSWLLVVAEELYGDFEDLETGVVHKGKAAAGGEEV